MTKNSNQGGPASRPAGGVKHSDSDLVETGMLSAKKKHFAEQKAVFLATPESFKVVGGGFPTLIGQNVRKTRVFPLASKGWSTITELFWKSEQRSEVGGWGKFLFGLKMSDTG